MKKRKQYISLSDQLTAMMFYDYSFRVERVFVDLTLLHYVIEGDTVSIYTSAGRYSFLTPEACKRWLCCLEKRELGCTSYRFEIDQLVAMRNSQESNLTAR